MSFESDNEDSIVNTKSLLGYIDVAIDKETQPFPNDSIIGSQPIPMHEESPIPNQMVHCSNCNGLMRLLLQCNADLTNTWYERCIYVFACIEPQCRRTNGAIKCIRGIKKDPIIMAQRQKDEEERLLLEKKKKEQRDKKEKEEKEKMLGLFGSKSETGNPFASSSPSSSSSSSNPFASSSNPFEMKKVEKETTNIDSEPSKPNFAQVVKQGVKTPKINGKSVEHTKLPEFPGYILYFETEVLDPKNQYLPPLPDNLKVQEDGSVLDDNVSVTSGNLPKINPEKSKENEEIAKMVDDSTFQNFSRIVSFNTGQVVRYEINGQPVLYSSKDKVSTIFYDNNGKLKPSTKWNIPSPSYNPSGSRRFELQLMPKMIIDLEKDANIDILRDGMEWGTIIVATDSDDFVPLNWVDSNGVAYLEEWCGVQWEEEVPRH